MTCVAGLMVSLNRVGEATSSFVWCWEVLALLSLHLVLNARFCSYSCWFCPDKAGCYTGGEFKFEDFCPILLWVQMGLEREVTAGQEQARPLPRRKP